MEKIERNSFELANKIEDAFWEVNDSGYENVKLYESGYMGHYMDANSVDFGEGEVLASLDKSDLLDISGMEVSLADYFWIRAQELAAEIGE